MGYSDDRRYRTAAEELRRTVSGGVTLLADGHHADAFHVWNRAVPHRPAMVAFCRRDADVAAAVRVARRHGIPLSVRGGGHHWAGWALRPDGLVIDLTGMRQVSVDADAKVATVAGGALNTDVAAAADAHGLVAVIGNCGAVGMAGLTLGGGYSPLCGRYGMACDNLLSAEVVLADGERVTASADRNPGLFWALRGGGGNFGVVTAMQVRLHDAGPAMLAGQIVFPGEQAETVIGRYPEVMAAMPEEGLGVTGFLAAGPDGKLALQLQCVWVGDQHRGEQAIGKLQALGTPLVTDVAPGTYSAMLEPVDAWVDATDGCHWHLRTRWLPGLTPGAAGALAAAMERRTAPTTAIGFHEVRGAATRIPSQATAFGLRRPHMLLEIIAGWPAGEDGAAHRRWTQDTWDSLAPFALPGGYANLLGPHDEAARDAYGGNAAQLLAAKRRYDPDGVFASAIPLPVGEAS